MLEKLKKIKNHLISRIDPKTKKRMVKALPGTLLLVLLFSVVLFTIFHSTDGFTTLIETEHASLITEKGSMSFTGYTLRDEQLITSEYGGSVYYLAQDAQRVNPGDELARVYEAESDETVEILVKEIDRCIEILEESIGDGHFTLGESKNVQNGISKIYYTMMRAVANGNAGDIASSYDDLLILLNKMQVFLNNDGELSELLEEYRTQKSRLEDYYKGNYQTVSAEEGGYFFKGIDGYEGVYSSKNIEELTYNSFFEMIGKDSNKGEYVGKMLVDYRWYIAVPTVKGISDTFAVGGEYDMTFPDNGNRILKMELDNVIFDDTGARSIMLFSCGIVGEELSSLRVQQVSVVSRNVTGYRIPVSAVCELGGSTGVYILKDGMASFRKVVILYEGDGYYIVSAENRNSDGYYVYLALNDNIIINCKNMYEGKVIE